MKIFKSQTKNILYFGYRLIAPVVDPVRLFLGLTGYVKFIKDSILYKAKDPTAKIFNLNLYPIVDENISLTPFDAHYFYQQLWCFENILKNKPPSHVDIGSTYTMSGYISKIVPTTFIDLRPIKTNLKQLSVRKGDILNLPYVNNSVGSISCLHVAEHIGLGRYGDAIDPQGTKKACLELARILKPGGQLYFSLPIGKKRLCFNAHRIFPPATIIHHFKDLKLLSFSAVDDNGKFHPNVRADGFSGLNYGCGLFIFTK